MKYVVWVVAVLWVVFGGVRVSAQQVNSSSEIYEARIHAWIDSELTAHPQKKIMLQRLDAYGRVLYLQAAQALKISLSELHGESIPDEDEIQSPPNDSGVATDVSKKKTTWQNETSIAISRAHSNIIVAGSNDFSMTTLGMPVYYTTNTGQTWLSTHIPIGSSQYLAYGDPMLASGPDSTLYYAYILYANDGTGHDNMTVATSTNGKNWRNGASLMPDNELSGFEDKEQIVVDLSPSSPYYGRVYIAWLHLFAGQQATYELRIAYSDDHCQSWSDPIPVAETIAQFSEVRTGKNGEVFISYSDPEEYGGSGYQEFVVSTDGAQTFTTNDLAQFSLYPVNTEGRSAVKGDLGPRAFPYISFDVDQKTNDIYLVYGDSYLSQDVFASYAVQYFVKSTDLGSTWTSPIAVGYNSQTPGDAGGVRDRFDPWVSVNQKTGDAFLTCYSSEYDPANLLITPFRINLNNMTSTPSKPLEATGFDPTAIAFESGALPFIGDYIGSDATDSVFAATWTEGTKGSGVLLDAEVYVYIGLPTSTDAVSSLILVSSNRLRLASVYPNPAVTKDISVQCFSPHETAAELALYDLSGTFIASLWNGILGESSSIRIDVALPRVAAGTYFLRLTSSVASDQAKIVIRQ